MSKVLFFIYSMIIALPMFADNNQICHNKTIYSVQSPIYENKKDSFKYYYQKIIKNHDGPVFIIIPGGPGGSSMNKNYAANEFFDFNELQWGLPDNSNIILTDPRTRGCNSTNKLPIDSLTTANVLNDIISIIKKENLKKYVLIGHSYGTIVATRLANKISEKQMIPPMAVVLSGVLGHSFHNEKRFIAYDKAWQYLKEQLPTELTSLFPNSLINVESDFIFPLGLSAEYWVTFLSSGLTEGASLINGKYYYPLKDNLMLLLSKNQEDINLLKEKVLSSISSRNLAKSDFFKQIYCSEVHQGDKDCLSSGYTNFNYYDSKDYQINSPIIYFQGEQDPATPIEHAKYHYKQQSKAEKIMVVSNISGHTTGFMINPCKNDFWIHFFNKDIDNIKVSLSKCGSHLELFSN